VQIAASHGHGRRILERLATVFSGDVAVASGRVPVPAPFAEMD